ncbi:MAG: glycerate kinase [Chloroflexi bacterium]|nr:MAG: glycerate kinase [Chloroflexota bacterium]
MRILIAPQEYKGTLTAREAAEAIAAGARRAAPDAELDLVPLSDGGPGLVDALLTARPGRRVQTRVQDPLGRPIDASFALFDDGAAVVEMAAPAGLSLLNPEERDPRTASTCGVGELIAAALAAGSGRLIVGVGGSATNDGGAGMAAALGARLLDADGRVLPPGGAALARLDRIDVSGLDTRLKDTETLAAADVINPLCGPEGASLVYGPQKGATPEVARQLDEALRHYAEVVERDTGMRVLAVPGAGAAGGLGAGLIAFLGARVRPGFEVVAEAVRLGERLSGADLVLTGEGRLDAQTMFGKAVSRVAEMARAAGVAVIAVPGSLGDGWESARQLLDGVEPVHAYGGESASHALAAAAERAVRDWRARQSRQN